LPHKFEARHQRRLPPPRGTTVLLRSRRRSPSLCLQMKNFDAVKTRRGISIAGTLLAK
jgi:hypothetical protein